MMDVLNLEIAGKVSLVRLDRPPVNALTLALYGAIADLFEEIGSSENVHCVVFTAAGSRAFCAGLDLKEFLAAKVEEDAARAAIVRRTFAAVRHCRWPVIAAVNG